MSHISSFPGQEYLRTYCLANSSFRISEVKRIRWLLLLMCWEIGENIRVSALLAVFAWFNSCILFSAQLGEPTRVLSKINLAELWYSDSSERPHGVAVGALFSWKCPSIGPLVDSYVRIVCLIMMATRQERRRSLIDPIFCLLAKCRKRDLTSWWWRLHDVTLWSGPAFNYVIRPQLFVQ